MASILFGQQSKQHCVNMQCSLRCLCHLMKYHQNMLFVVRVHSVVEAKGLYVFRPVVATARLADPMRLRNPVFSELPGQQTLEPLETVEQRELVLVRPAQKCATSQY